MVFSHRIKKTMFMNRPVNIVLQNENGPCPLLSIANVLILQGHLQIHPDRSEITSDQLIEMIGIHLIDKNPPLKDESLQRNQQQTLDDVMGILPTMENGLDVNVKFDKVSSFEYDARISVFDMLGVSLYHGWVADPSDAETFEVVGKLSYNQLVDRIILADTKKMEQEKKKKNEESPKAGQSSGNGVNEEDGVKKEEEEGEGGEEEGGKGEGEGEEEAVAVKRKEVVGSGDDDEEAMELLRQEVEELEQEEKKQQIMRGGGEEEDSEEIEKELKTAREEAGEREEEKQELELEQAMAVKLEGEQLQVEEEKEKEEGAGENQEEKKEEEAEAEEEEAIEDDEETVALKREAAVAQRFLQETASQLTYLGLTELHSSVDERKLCVFFRNNHFSTMFRMNGELYLLLTDQGYEKQHTVAWEKLNEINGDTEIVSPEFDNPKVYTNIREDLVVVNSSDRQLALQLQQEENERAAPPRPRSPPRSANEEFIEQQRRALAAYKQQKQRGNRGGRGRGDGDERAKKGGCALS